MTHFRLRAGNNFIAALAVILIIVSMVNYVIALNYAKSRQLTAASIYSSGQVSLCASFQPNLTVDFFHQLTEYDHFYYDVNATGGTDESQTTYYDNTTMFNISPSAGAIDFYADNSHVGMHDVRITAVENICNSFSVSATMRFNITNKNNPPTLVSVVLTNESGGSGNVTYSFPIANKIEFWEDIQYNVSLIATDPDLPYGDALTYIVVWYDPLNPGVQVPDLFTLNDSTGKTPFKPLQGEVGSHLAEFWVWDRNLSQAQSDKVQVSVYNINDPPVLHNKTVLMAQTAYSGEPYYLEVNATDVDGDILSYSASFMTCSKVNMSNPDCNIFTINQTTGIIDFTPVILDVGNYSVNYSVYDGHVRDYVNGSFTVVEYANHPPNITYWDPVTYDVTPYEGDSVNFSIIVYDPDSGWNTASVQWYIDGIPIVGQNAYNYIFSTGYDSSGVYNITVVASDGELSDSHEWNVIVLDRAPPSGIGGPSGSILGGRVCIENWRCTTWSECSKEGVQIRVCIDVSGCNTTMDRPQQTMSCTYTEEPTCYDSIRNCHGGACEILTDCGGPCPPCPTCSDRIKNCHANGECEEDIDCGGPCRPCPKEERQPECGNSVCEAGELYSCIEDCIDFWIDTAIFMVIIVLLVVISILLYVYRKETVLLYLYRKVRGE